MKALWPAAFLLGSSAFSQEPRPPMKDSLQKQKESAIRQIRALTGAAADPKSWFQHPWNPEPLGPPVEFGAPKPPCDPLPADKLDVLIQGAASRHAVSAGLLRAVMEQESGFRPCATSSKGAQGLMQLMPAVQQEFGVADPFDPEQSVSGGARYLKQLLARYQGNLDLALAAYNAGPANVGKEGPIPDIPETREYVEAVKKKLSSSGQPASR